MKRFLVVSAFLALGTFLAVLSFVGRSTRTSHENMVRDRGQTPTQGPRLTLDRGRFGSEASVPLDPATWTGVLVDAGCNNRDAFALGAPAAGHVAVEPGATGEKAGAAKGITVSGKTLASERSDVLPILAPDVAFGSMDPACAVTGSTRGFAVYLSNGVLKNLDEGGNTKAMEMFQASPQGQAVLNGKSLGEKLRVAVKGMMHGDRIVVEDIRRL